MALAIAALTGAGLGAFIGSFECEDSPWWILIGALVGAPVLVLLSL